MLPTPQQARTPMQPARSLDPEARALKLFDGKDDGILTRNPWRRVRTFDVGSTAFPTGLEVKINDALTDVFGGARIGLAWDDAELLEMPPQQAGEGTTLAVRVSSARGRRLEVWADDAAEVGSVTLVAASELERRAQQREEIENAPPPNPLDPITKPLGRAIDTAQLMMLGGVVLAVVFVVVVAGKWDGAIPSPGLNVG